MKKEHEEFTGLRSEEMNELLTTPPKWIVNSGGGVLLLALSLLVSLAWLVRYPDEIPGEVIVTTSKAPIELSNQSYVQLKALNIVENQEVRAGDLLAQFDFRVNSHDFEKALAYLQELEKLADEFPSEIPVFDQQLQLGSFGERWTNLLSKIREWNLEYALSPEQEELKLIRREIAFREQLQVISGKKMKLSESEYALMEEQLAGGERLAAQNAISRQSLTQEKHSRNQSMQAVEGQKEQAIQNLITLNSLRKEILKLEHDTRSERLQRSAEIRQILTGLINEFLNWKKDAAWTAPCSGKVIFNKMLQVNRYYKAEEASLIIVPDGNGYQAVASVISSGSGKIKKGQRTFIELTDYPKTEFGMLEGRVSAITQMDKNGKYELRIELPNQLKTTYNLQIPPRAQLKGKVIVITKDKRLLMRFFEQFTALIK